MHVASEVKASLVLRPGLTRAHPRGAEVAKIDRVRWEAQLPPTTPACGGGGGAAPKDHAAANGRWLPLPPHGRTFPWDPAVLRPNADMVGLVVRAVATAIDPASDRPIVEFEGDADFDEVTDERLEAASVEKASTTTATRRRCRPVVYRSAAVLVEFSDKHKQAMQAAAARPQFGFHALEATAQHRRLIVSITRGKLRHRSPTTNTPAAAEHEEEGSMLANSNSATDTPPSPVVGVLVQAVEVPDDDAAPVRRVWCRPLTLTDRDTAAEAFELDPNDCVTLSIRGDGPTSEAPPPHAAANYDQRTLRVLVRSADDRDVAVACLRHACQAWVDQARSPH